MNLSLNTTMTSDITLDASAEYVWLRGYNMTVTSGNAILTSAYIASNAPNWIAYASVFTADASAAQASVQFLYTYT